MFSYMRWVVILFSGLTLLWTITGCSDDDNPVDSENESEHFHAVGSKLVLDGEDVIVATTSDSADVTGLIELHEGEEVELEAWFLNDEGEWFYPADDADAHADHELEVVIGNGDMIEGDVHGWEVHLTGAGEGASWVRLRVKHIDHYGYLSPHLRTSIQHEEGYHGAPVGMFLVAGTDTLVHINSSNEVTGSIDVGAGSSTDAITLFLFDENDVVFQPGDDHSLGLVIDDEGIATSTAQDTWVFVINGLAAGETSAEFSILHGDHSHYDSPAVSIVVQ